MKVLIAGSHGMVGSAVTRHLLAAGHDVVRLVRSAPEVGEVWWDPDAGQIDEAGLEGLDAVVNVATMRWPMRWSNKVKQALRANRVATNRLLAEALAGCKRKPEVLVCAAGAGYYASSGDEVLTEESPAGAGFLSVLDQDGEAATAAASDAGIRVVHLRIPMVLGGQALQFAGFRAGDAQQWVSWIGRDELAAIIEFVLRSQSLRGAINACSPNPMRGEAFATRAAWALHRKPGCSIPAFMVHLVMGEMGDELMLASRRLRPARLLAAGYRFRFPKLEDMLVHERQVAESAPARQRGRAGTSPAWQPNHQLRGY
jgi:uncharacterized protein (TIGR01777 family)